MAVSYRRRNLWEDIGEPREECPTLAAVIDMLRRDIEVPGAEGIRISLDEARIIILAYDIMEQT